MQVIWLSGAAGLRYGVMCGMHCCSGSLLHFRLENLPSPEMTHFMIFEMLTVTFKVQVTTKYFGLTFNKDMLKMWIL